jgi:hypothetical protein
MDIWYISRKVGIFFSFWYVVPRKSGNPGHLRLLARAFHLGVKMVKLDPKSSFKFIFLNFIITIYGKSQTTAIEKFTFLTPWRGFEPIIFGSQCGDTDYYTTPPRAT